MPIAYHMPSGVASTSTQYNHESANRGIFPIIHRRNRINITSAPSSACSCAQLDTSHSLRFPTSTATKAKLGSIPEKVTYIAYQKFVLTPTFNHHMVCPVNDCTLRAVRWMPASG